METGNVKFLYKNWQQKAIAFFVALFIWISVNQSIIDVRTIPNVPIRVFNLPQEKTIVGIQPNRYLRNRISLTLSGSKDVVNAIGQGDIEVQLDASAAENDQWIVKLAKQNLTSLNPNIDLNLHITQVEHPDLVITFSDQVKESIPVLVTKPKGAPPADFRFLDIWPTSLEQLVTGPKEEIQQLQVDGLIYTFNLDLIPEKTLIQLMDANPLGQNEAFSLPIPQQWKTINQNNQKVPLNDPSAKKLQVSFVKKQMHPIDRQIPLLAYYPINTKEMLNPKTAPIAATEGVVAFDEYPIYIPQLYLKNVTRRFVETIQNNLAIVIVVVPKNEREFLQWSVEVIDDKDMEDSFVALGLSDWGKDGQSLRNPKEVESLLRNRFRKFMQELTLYTKNDRPLSLIATLDEGVIHITVSD